MLLVAVVGLSIASCGGDDASTGTTQPDATTATALTSTVLPTTAAPVEDQSSSASVVFPEGEPVDFVLLADSGGGGVAALYAAKAAEALDREIRVHDLSRGGATAPDILSGIQQQWADDVADAEIIVFYVHPGGFEPPGFLPCLEAIDTDDPDVTFPPTWDPPVATTVEDWQGYQDTLDQIYDEIWKLRAGQPTIIRAYGVWLPWLAQWQQMGIASACVAGEEAVDQARQESAEAHEAIFVSIMDVFTGPEHDQDPVVKGWLAEDGMHLNPEGHIVLVDALAAAGFEPSETPRT